MTNQRKRNKLDDPVGRYLAYNPHVPRAERDRIESEIRKRMGEDRQVMAARATLREVERWLVRAERDAFEQVLREMARQEQGKSIHFRGGHADEDQEVVAARMAKKQVERWLVRAKNDALDR